MLWADDGPDKALSLIGAMGNRHVAAVDSIDGDMKIGCVNEHEVIVACNGPLARLRQRERAGSSGLLARWT